MTKPAWKSKPSWYVIATEDRAFQPSLEQAMAAKIGATTISVPSGHLAMLSHPREVTDLIITAASGR